MRIQLRLRSLTSGVNSFVEDRKMRQLNGWTAAAKPDDLELGPPTLVYKRVSFSSAADAES